MIYGVASNSKGQYLSGNKDPAYKAWFNMISRCYDEKLHRRLPRYVGCSVSPDWLEYQTFAQWFYSDPYWRQGWHLDKDIIQRGNKVYSATTCAFVPDTINLLVSSRNSRRGAYPVGVSFDKSVSLFKAKLSFKGKTITLGNFKNPEQAFAKYKSVKEAYIQTEALTWKDQIDPRVCASLLQWEISRDD